MKERPPTKMEREVLAVVLRELRRAMRMRTQLSLTIDPPDDRSGMRIFASPAERGRTYVLTKKKGPRA